MSLNFDESPKEQYGSSCNSDIQYIDNIYYMGDTLDCIHYEPYSLYCDEFLDCDGFTGCGYYPTTESQYVNCNDIFTCRYEQINCMR